MVHSCRPSVTGVSIMVHSYRPSVTWDLQWFIYVGQVSEGYLLWSIHVGLVSQWYLLWSIHVGLVSLRGSIVVHSCRSSVTVVSIVVHSCRSSVTVVSIVVHSCRPSDTGDLQWSIHVGQVSQGIYSGSFMQVKCHRGSIVVHLGRPSVTGVSIVVHSCRPSFTRDLQWFIYVGQVSQGDLQWSIHVGLM